MTPKNIDECIAVFPKETQVILKKIRAVITREVPDVKEAMTYGIPTFKLDGKNLVHFSGFAEHIGFYPTPSGIATFKKELSAYKTAKGSVQFRLDKPIPYALIKKIVAFRVTEVRKVK